jgi:hypothetical protein
MLNLHSLELQMSRLIRYWMCFEKIFRQGSFGILGALRLGSLFERLNC